MKHLRRAAIAAITLVALAGCGTTAAAPTSTSTSTAAAAPSTAAAAGTPGAGASGTGGAPSAAPVTVSGTLDANTTAWFATTCTAVSPLLDAVMGATGAMVGGGDGGSPQHAQAALAAAFDKAGTALTAAVAKLRTLPPPSIDNGSRISTEMIAAMQSAAPAMQQIGASVSSAKVTTPADLSKVLSAAQSKLTASVGGLSMDQFALSAPLEAAVAKIPACAPLMALGGALGGSSAASPAK